MNIVNMNASAMSSQQASHPEAQILGVAIGEAISNFRLSGGQLGNGFYLNAERAIDGKAFVVNVAFHHAVEMIEVIAEGEDQEVVCSLFCGENPNELTRIAGLILCNGFDR